MANKTWHNVWPFVCIKTHSFLESSPQCFLLKPKDGSEHTVVHSYAIDLEPKRLKTLFLLAIPTKSQEENKLWMKGSKLNNHKNKNITNLATMF